MNVLMLYPKFPTEAFWNCERSLAAFTQNTTNMPPLGLLTVASYLPPDFEVRLIDRNLQPETESDWKWADVVFISLMIIQRDDYELCVRTAKAHGKPIAVGGPVTHALPELITATADWVCFGEIESIADSLVRDLRAGARGKHYDGGNSTDMTTVEPPRFDLLPDPNAYGCMPIQFSRGCPFRCEFCDIIEIYGRVPRTKDPQQVLAELALLKSTGFRGSVFLVDDNLIGNKKNAKLLLKQLIPWCREQGYPFRFSTEVSLNVADDDELLDAMFDANFVNIFIGIETPDPKLLKEATKLQNIPGDPIAKLQRIRQHGIHIIGGFIVGFDGEQRDVFEAQKNFIQASGIGTAMIGLLQALPHTQLSRRLEREGRLIGGLRAAGVTTAEGMNFVPKGPITKREYLEGYCALIKELYAPEAHFRRILPALLSLRYRKWHRGLRIVWWTHFGVMPRIIYHLGLISRKTRRHFWRTFLRVMWSNPLALEALGHDCFYFYYLEKHVEFVRQELSRYLLHPAPADVLDETAIGRDSPDDAVTLRTSGASGTPNSRTIDPSSIGRVPIAQPVGGPHRIPLA